MQSVGDTYPDLDRQRPRSGWRLKLTNFGYRARRLFGRRVRHLDRKRFTPPEAAQPIFSFTVLGLALLYGVAAGGHAERAVDQLSSTLGFGIKEVRISGLEATNQNDILLALDGLGVGSLPLMDTEEARLALAGLPWVETVSVAKLYPQTVAISLTEKQPVARWQRGRNTAVSVIDQFGQVITQQLTPDLHSLPLVVGDGAEYQVAEITGYLRTAPWLRSHIYAAVLVSSRRWNLVTHEGVVIRLPENDIAAALERLRQHVESDQLLDKDIRVVDLRFADRLVVRLSPDAAADRRVEMAKSIKK